MKSNLRMAKALVRIARMLVAYNRNELESQLKKRRSDLNEASLKEYLDCLEGMDAKEQKVALYWISKKRLILPEDLSKFQDAINLINKQHLDFQKFEGPMEVINRNDKSTLRIKSQDAHFSPSSEKAFSSPYNAGDGVVIYQVKNSKKGQLAVRKAIDVNWGYDKNPWCLAARKDGFDQNEINALSHEQAEQLGLYSDDVLAVAWKYWTYYNAYPKRIAFKNGKLLAFSAGNEKQHVEWWDKNDEPHSTIPGSNAMDDIEFLKKHGKYNLLESQNASPKALEELAEDEDWQVRSGVAINPKTPVEVLRKLAEDKDSLVRMRAAENPNTPAEVLRKLGEDNNYGVRHGVATNPHTPAEAFTKLAEDRSLEIIQEVAKNSSTPAEVLKKLTEDNFLDVRYAVAQNPNTPAEALMKLAEDEHKEVRWGVARNPSTPAEAFTKLAEDIFLDVRHAVAENPRTPAEILTKMADAKDSRVRYEVTQNPSTPAEVLRKLAEDEDRDMRSGTAWNSSTPVEVLRKLAEDEDKWVRLAVARNPKTPAEVLMELAEDEDNLVRKSVAENPGVPAETLRKLAEDEDEKVREVARRRLKQQ